MQTKILRLKDLGQDNFWRVLHESASAASSTPLFSQPLSQPLSQPDKALDGCQVLMLSGHGCPAEQAAALENQALISAAVHSLGGTVHSMTLPQELCTSVRATALAALASATAHICVTHSLPHTIMDVLAAHCDIPLLNAGSTLAHADTALADLACIQHQGRPLDTVRVAWVGGVNGLAHSLMEAAIYAPLELFMAVPAWGEPDHDLTALALKAGAKIFLTRETHLAVDGAHHVYAGQAFPAPEDRKHALQAGMRLTPELLALTSENARVFSGTALHGTDSGLSDIMPDQALEKQRLHCRLHALRSLLRLLAARS